uniref:Uncharacterized protein n=1 Tax=Tanacetum cinerariifolium TaxID=118510 RepID=A0A6L2L4R7_TANCI|nr:hypothetical protein [Tanacetum cinerariifolium]
MAESSQIQQQDQPKRPVSPIPFAPPKQVGFNLKDVIFNTNNEVALLYPEHSNNKTFKCVFDFISKCCLREPFTRSPNMYNEYLSKFWYTAKALKNSKVSFLIPTDAPPSIDVVRQWFPTIGYGEEVFAKGNLIKSLFPSRWRLLMGQIIQCLGGKTRGFDKITNKDAIILYSLANEINIDYANIFWEDIIIKLNKKQMERVVLKPNQPEGPPFTAQMMAIHNVEKLVTFKAPKPSSNAKRVPQGIKPRAQPRYKKQSTSSKKSSVSSKEATKGGSSKAPTEDQQATGGLTSLGVTSEERADTQLSSGTSVFNLNKPVNSASFIIQSEFASGYDALADSISEVDPRLSSPNYSIPQQQA